jgi:hypothetical protein
MPWCRDDLDSIESDRTEMLGEPLCGSGDIGSVFGKRADARQAKERFQFVEEAITMRCSILVGIHREFEAIRWTRRQKYQHVGWQLAARYGGS